MAMSDSMLIEKTITGRVNLFVNLEIRNEIKQDQNMPKSTTFATRVEGYKKSNNTITIEPNAPINNKVLKNILFIFGFFFVSIF